MTWPLTDRVVFDSATGIYDDPMAERSDFYEEHYVGLHPTLHAEDVPGKLDAILHAGAPLFAHSRLHQVLDVGCGSCALLNALIAELRNSHRLRVTGIGVDISQAILAHGDKAPDIIRLRADCANLPIESGSVSLALAVDVVEHAVDPVPILSELARVAEYLILKVPIERSLYTALRGWSSRLAELRKRFGHEVHYSRKQLLAVVAKEFTVITETYSVIPRRRYPIMIAQEVLLRWDLKRLYAMLFGGFAVLLLRSKRIR